MIIVGGLNTFKCPKIPFQTFVINQGLLISKHDTRYKKEILVEII
jgi:hypothetical protein